MKQRFFIEMGGYHLNHHNQNIKIFPVIVPESVINGLRSINFYLVKQENSLTLIDAGLNTDDCWYALQTTLKVNGYTLHDITEILLTHHHVDHVGLVNRIVALHEIPVYAHPNAIPRLKRDHDFLQMRVEFFKQLYNEMGCGEMGERQVSYLSNSIIKNKDKKIHSEIEEINNHQLMNFDVIPMFGHAPDQVAFFNRQHKCLFGGDLLIGHISSNALVEPNEQGNRMKTLIQHKHSLTSCLSLEADLVYSGHGITIEKPNDLIQKRLLAMDAKAETFKNYIQTGISTANEIAQLHYKHKYEKEFPLVMSEIIGHLDYLEEQRKVEKECDKGVWHYFVS